MQESYRLIEYLEAPITKALLHYFPDWEPPENTKEWNQCLCPAHPENRPSCAVNYEIGAVKCLACDFSGDVIGVIKKKEKVGYADAVRYSETILGRSYKPLRGKSRRNRGRRVFGSSRSDDRGDRAIPSWVRS